MCTKIVCKPCTTCTIRHCKHNKNPNLDKVVKTSIELTIEEELFRRGGCPYK